VSSATSPDSVNEGRREVPGCRVELDAHHPEMLEIHERGAQHA
jgi:hypothetical protein